MADARARRSEATCAKLVAIAERLFAERGIKGVSLNDINTAAGQRNKNATHYHFGGKQGLLQAILDKHQPGITARQHEMLDALDRRGDADLRSVVHALVQPIADKLADPDGGRNYLRVNAELAVTHTMAALKLRESPLRISHTERFQQALRQRIPELPEPVAQQRGLLVAVLLAQSLAELARMLDGGNAAGALADPALFVANLEDSLTAMLAAPPSADTLKLSS